MLPYNPYIVSFGLLRTGQKNVFKSVIFSNNSLKSPKCLFISHFSTSISTCSCCLISELISLPPNQYFKQILFQEQDLLFEVRRQIVEKDLMFLKKDVAKFVINYIVKTLKEENCNGM